MTNILILVGLLFFILFTGNFIGSALALFGLAIIVLFTDVPFAVIGNSLWNTLNNYTFAAIPLYFLLGEIISTTGIAQRIYGSMAPLFSRLPGGLLQSNIGTCALFAAISGSSTATTAAIGSIAYDELENRGYSSSALIGSLAGGGTLGILIPPSTILILYGALQNVSVGKLFIAGIVPGIIISLSYMFYIGIYSKLKPSIAPHEQRVPIGKALRLSAQAWPFIILLLAVLGTVFAGLATATEAAGIGVIAAMVLAAILKRLSLKAIGSALKGTLATFSSLAAIFIGAVILAQAVAFTGLPDYLMELISESGLGRYSVIVLVFLLYLFMGPYSVAVIPGIGVSKSKWAKLPDDLKAIFKGVGKAVLWDFQYEKWQTSEYEKYASTELESKGMKEIEPFSMEDRIIIQKAILEEWLAECEKIGPEAVAHYNKVTSIINIPK